MNILAAIGKPPRESLNHSVRVAAIAWAACLLALRPSSWPRTVRDVLARQLLFTGVEALRLVTLVAVLMGISIVVQIQLWMSRVGQSDFAGPILVTVVIRELGPLLTNFLVISRSGTAISSEMASMKVNGEIGMLNAQGLSPMAYLVMPRAIGVAISALCLTIFFVFICLTSGFLMSLLSGAHSTPAIFIDSIFSSIQPADLLNLLAKSLIPGLLTGVICCEQGLNIDRDPAQIPQAATRGQVHSLAALFTVSAIISLVTYL